MAAVAALHSLGNVQAVAAPRHRRSGLAPVGRRAGRARAPLRVQAVAEFVHRATDRREAILLAKIQAHTASTASALVLRDTGEPPAAQAASL